MGHAGTLYRHGGDIPANPFDHFYRILSAGVDEQDGELLAPDPADKVAAP